MAAKIIFRCLKMLASRGCNLSDQEQKHGSFIWQMGISLHMAKSWGTLESEMSKV